MMDEPGEGGTYAVRMNPERCASIWWDEARVSPVAPVAMGPMLEIFGSLEITVSAVDAAAIRRWAEGLPGWDDGPPPLLIERLAR